MCGIVGYYNKSQVDVSEVLLNGLKRLEYRGYDSAGLACMDKKTGLYLRKSVGKVINLEKKLDTDSDTINSQIGIAHTRWATHGQPTEANAHPHQSWDGKILLVHNGIVENYQEIKEKLINQGVTFYSQTDTEVVANLIASKYQGDLKKAVLESTKEIQGAYAIVVFSTEEPNRLIGLKNGSPLILGVSKEEYILASDVSAIMSRTKKVVYLEDRELVDIKSESYELISFTNRTKKAYIKDIEWDEEQANKEGYDHYLLKEIMEQPKSAIESTRGRLILDEGRIKFGGLLDIQDRLREIDKVVILGMGSSFYAAQIIALYFENTVGITAIAEMSSEFRYKANVINQNTWVIALSQSGETKDTIEAIKEAQGKGALVTGIVNVVGSSISRMTEAGVYCHVGPEISVASTKALTSFFVIGLMHAILLGRQRGLSINQSQELIQDLIELPKYIQEVLDSCLDIKKLANKFKNYQNFIYLGRRFNYPVVKEGALKFKELTYIHAEAFSGGELKHGPISMIDADFPTIAICNQDTLYEKQLSSLIEITSRKGPVLVVANTGDDKISDKFADIIYVPATKTEEVQAIVNNISLQLFAYYVTINLGNDVDQPRNLAKSVTVE